MTDDPRVQQLLEELHASGATPEAVCALCPELLPIVRKQWRRICRLRADLDALFPSPDEPTPPPDGTNLPQVPGYEVEAVLGRGGMGIVFQARHLRLNRPVALKMVLAGAYADQLDRARFQREAEAAAGIRHPNIVQVYDVGESNGRPYFTMEFIEGGSLAKRLAGTPQLPQHAAQLLATLAEAVQAAHDKGIVHRDLKPANVLLTDDGTPKISDFGLARRLEGEAGITRTGAAVGTPSYMAPEQARGGPDAVGPLADVYALGAILYELLTGRPPFRAATAAETVQQVITQEPAPPSRLNDQVPRDLETICLKCLCKEPGRRYASAAALADDLRRFGEGRPIHARPVGRGERLWRWGRRNPMAVALLATALALVGLTSGGSVWFVQQRTMNELALHKDVDTTVVQTENLRRRFHFREARNLLEQAWQRLEPAGSDELRRQVERAQANIRLAERLDNVRINSATLAGGVDAPAAIESLYISAFAQIGREGDDIKVVAARVWDSALKEELIAALDEWASIATDPGRREWLLAVAREADNDQARNHLRRSALWTDPIVWKDPIVMDQLTQDLKAADFSPQLALALSRVAYEFDVDSVPLLTAAQARYPQDFWVNAWLGSLLAEARRWNEALGYCRAALAIRPDVSVAHGILGNALYKSGRRDEAHGHFEQALRIDPESVMAHGNLAIALQDKGRTEEAMAHFEQALRLDPKSAGVHFNLGNALMAKGQLIEAIDQFQQAVSINPKSAVAHYNLGVALLTERRLDEAIEHFQKTISIDPKSFIGHNNLGVALGEKGRHEEAIEHFQQALKIEPKSLRGHTVLGIAYYSAACAALQRAAGRNPTTEPLSEQERADKRRQALAWLRSDLELTLKLIRDDKVSAKSVAAWQFDSALASVRNRTALAELPDTEREEWQSFWADVAAVATADPVGQGRSHAARREWAQAADGYARVLKNGPTDEGHFWYEYAALLLLSGDRPGYVKACAHLVERCGKDKGPRPYHVARAFTLTPHAVGDKLLPSRLAEKELQNSREFWSLTEQGALAYRAGQFREAVPLFQQSLRANPKPGAAVLNWLWLALAHHRLENAEEAQRWLGKAQVWLDQYGDGMPARAEAEVGLHLHNWLEAHVLRREAETVLASMP